MALNLLKHWRSLRTRISLSIVIMVLPAAILMLSAYHSIRYSVDALTEVVAVPLVSLVKSQALQKQILKIELPFQMYLQRGDSADREAFVRKGIEIDLLFEGFIGESSDLKNIGVVKMAQAEWQEAILVGESLLLTAGILDENAVNEKNTQFARHLGRVSSLIDEIGLNAQEAITRQHQTAQANEWKSLGVLLLIFSLGLLLAILAALSLGESVIKPIRRLEKIVNQFGKGETGRRITLQSNDELGELASAFNMLAERYEHIKGELDYLSVHDNLTGLYDRSKLHEAVTSEMVRAKRYDRSFSLVLIDINHFHEVNKCYGRLVGDSVLCSVANKISTTVRPTDASSRYGGDEFAIVLSETDAKGASDTVQRLYDAIENNPLNIGDGKQLSISITITFATFPSDADSEAGLFVFAEHSLSNLKLNLQTANRA